MATPLTLVPDLRPDGVVLLTAVGEIDMSNTDVLAAALERTTGAVVLDLTSVGYLDSAGLSVLFAHVDRIELIAPPLLLPVLNISGFTDLAPVHASPGV
ncbi:MULTISPECIES: STAS domain-containing protein [Streptosporangium]|uniref:STAS domain-containing protein n=1 Tax=Streptosporangium jomthongense TaxID=1193683 RepID=A0ABV8ESN6_9ACTN